MNAGSHGWRTIAILLSCTLIAGYATRGMAAGGPTAKIHFKIEAGDGSTTLNEFSTQSGVQVLFGFVAVRGIPTRAVDDDLTPGDALDRMIAGTGLIYEFVNNRTVALTVLSSAPADAGIGTGKPRTWVQKNRSAWRPTDRRAPDASIAQIVITGAAPPFPQPVASSVYSLMRDDIDSTSSVTVQGLLHTLPQIFGGGPTEDTETGPEAVTNTGRGAGLNLRGLGAGSTLVLMNGRRLAGGGSEGTFVDVSNLPLAAVERVDILPDSSSTIYGGDAVGGVVNIVMRDSFEGNQTQIHHGAATTGQLNENYVSELIGAKTDASRAVLAFDLYSRDNLPAADRPQARSDLTAFGGGNFDLLQSNPGTLIVGNQMWAIPAGQDGKALNPATLVAGTRNYQNRLEGADLLPSQQRWSLFGSARHTMTQKVTFFTDALFSQRDVSGAGPAAGAGLFVPSTNPYYVNPMGGSGPVMVDYDFGSDFGPIMADARIKVSNVVAGLDIVDAIPLWHVTATAGYTSERQRVSLSNSVDFVGIFAALADANPATAFNPFGDGSHTNPATLAKLKTDTLLTTNSNLKSFNLTANGPLAHLPGGSAMLWVGGDRREQSFEADFLQGHSASPLQNGGNRDISTMFAELRLPFVSKENRRKYFENLELSFAGRYENYSDFGHTVTPRYGLAWSPRPGLGFRGTWSRSFRPPGLVDLDETHNISTVTVLPDPTLTAGRANVLVWSGENAGLKEERAKSWTAGLDFEPVSAPGLSLALTYFDIDFTDRMHQPQFGADLLSDPRFVPLITRNPTQAQRDEVCRRAPISVTPGLCLTAPIDAIIDLRVRNDTTMQTRGIDLIGKYERNTALGTLTLGLNGTYIIDFAEALAPGYPIQDKVSTQNYPIDLRLRGSVGWRRGGFEATAFVNYSDKYRDKASVPERQVSSWTTFDLSVRYNMDSSEHPWPIHTTFALGADNLFDKSAPFLNNQIGIGYDEENADLLGRVVSFAIRTQW